MPADAPTHRLGRVAAITLDVEQDCPPYLNTTRGMEEGLPRLLDLFAEKRVRATLFFTAEMAEKYPRLVKRAVDEGHEIGSHGHHHERYDRLTPSEAERLVEKATRILRRYTDEVVSFRAPNLKRPRWLLPILRRHGYTVDSSEALYKPPFPRGPRREQGLLIIPASVTSSVLRLPWRLQALVHRALPAPRVYFAHPWEYIDLSSERVRLDCRFNTGDKALSLLERLIDTLKQQGWIIKQMKHFDAK